MHRLISLIQHLAILVCAFMGLYIVKPHPFYYDSITYPFAPGGGFWLQLYSVLYPQGFASMFAALIGSWVYRKTMSYAALCALISFAVDYQWMLFSNLKEHLFHPSYLLAYCAGI
ncbi:hypothetical protein A7985_12905 [Pseudoalteromonas luteoviolacea]|uniref:Uncharacterized protein n=1 Tax=Pseudoalteromonas luteoviolacea TaxID=43657 RepID=A0A1C0TRC7_9GAMM|nr:hypothetical protein [Pseudoalteromonas luteoviolacea]OCQ21497.1 hypothetical protein A7985_12905 [Pseudoalteromonas luteoviolacea]